jgi:3-oxoadipate enol-lactonase
MQVHLNGFNLVYQENGNGIPLVMIHGFPLNRNMWKPQLEGIANKAQVITPDMRGFGESSSMPGVYYMEAMAYDIAALLDHLNLGTPVLAGHSMGGYVALAFCRKYIRWLSGLVLISSRATADTDEVKASRDKFAALAKERDGIKTIAESMAPRFFSPKTISDKPDLVKQVKSIMMSCTVDGIVGSALGMKARGDATALLSTIDIPTLIIHGADDVLVKRSESEAMAKQLPNARLEIIENAGHLPNLEQPKIFNDIVGDFVSKVR